MPFISHFLGITDLYCLVSSVWKKIVSGILLCSVFVFVFKWEYKVALASLSCWVHIHFLIGCNHSLNIIVTYVFFKCSVKGFFFFCFYFLQNFVQMHKFHINSILLNYIFIIHFRWYIFTFEMFILFPSCLNSKNFIQIIYIYFLMLQ